jgi:hypothetical protein
MPPPDRLRRRAVQAPPGASRAGGSPGPAPWRAARRKRHLRGFVDEEHIAFFEPGELRREIARLGDDRPRGRMESHSEFAGDDLGEGCLAEPGRPNKEHMIECLAPCSCRLDEDF